MTPETRNDLMIGVGVSAAALGARWALGNGKRDTWQRRVLHRPQRPSLASVAWPAMVAWATGAGLTAAIASAATRRVLASRRNGPGNWL